MARKNSHISILQFDERFIARLRVSRSETGVQVLSWEQEHGAWSAQDGTLEAALKAFVAAHGLAEDAVFTILPRHDITTRIILLPSHDAEEIANMVRFSAEEYVPYTIDEILIDQCILYGMPNGESLVLAAFAHRDVVEGHMRLLQQAGVTPDHVYLSTACLASAAMAVQEGNGQPFALVNLGSGGIEALVFDQNSHFNFGRAVAAAHDWRLSPEQNVEGVGELAVEVRATLAAFRRESAEGLEVDRVYLCSEMVETGGIASAVEPELARECSEAGFLRGLLKGEAGTIQCLPGAALGAALLAQGRGRIKIDLTPAAVAQDRELELVKRRALRVAAVVAALILGVGAVLYQQISQRDTYRAELDWRLQEMRDRSGGVVQKREQLQILREELRPDGSVLEYLANACDAVPDSGLNITEFSFDRSMGVDVKGRALSLDVIDAFGQALREIGKNSHLAPFAGAKRMYENQNIPERDKRIWEYHYTIPFETQEAGNEVSPKAR